MGWIIFCVIVVLALFIGLGLSYKKNSGISFRFRYRQLFSLLGFLLFLGGMVKNVGPNQVAIVFDPFNGGAQEATLTEGTYFMAPWVEIYPIDITQQELQFEAFSVQTRDSEYAMFIVEIKYKVSEVNALKVFRNYRGLPTNSMIRQDVQDSIKDAAEDFNIYDILGASFADVKDEAEILLREKLSSTGIDLVRLNLVDIDAGPAIEKAIVDKGLAKQQVEINKQLALAQTEEAERMRIEAEAEKAVLEIQAQAQAEVARLQAEGEYKAALEQAKAIEALAAAEAQARLEKISAFLPENYDTLTTDAERAVAWDNALSSYLEQLAYEAWNGDVPDTILDSDGNYIWDLNK